MLPFENIARSSIAFAVDLSICIFVFLYAYISKSSDTFAYRASSWRPSCAVGLFLWHLFEHCRSTSVTLRQRSFKKAFSALPRTKVIMALKWCNLSAHCRWWMDFQRRFRSSSTSMTNSIGKQLGVCIFDGAIGRYIVVTAPNNYSGLYIMGERRTQHHAPDVCWL